MGDDCAVQPSGDRWAAPGSLAEPELEPAAPGALPPTRDAAPSPSISVPSVRSSGPVDEASSGEVPNMRLRPMTVADVLDGAFTIIKARPTRLLGITALFVVPVHLLSAFLQRDALGGSGLWDALTSEDPAVVAETQQGPTGAEIVGSIIGWIVPGLALVAVAAVIARMVGGWMVGYDAKAGELLRTVGRRWWALLASYLLVHLAEVFVVPGLLFLPLLAAPALIMAVFVATAPIIGAEDVGPIDAMRRSWRLVMRRFWPVLGISVLIGVVSTLLSNALGGLPQVLALLIGLDVAWPLLAVGTIVGAVLTTPFVAAATVLLYLDLRVRNEGLDLELTARELIDDAAA
jgi:hypothetical protein